MKRYKIGLETMTDVQTFIQLAQQFPKDSLRVADSEGHEVSAQSMLTLLSGRIHSFIQKMRMRRYMMHLPPSW